MDGSYGLHMVMHLYCQPMLCNLEFQWSRKYKLRPNCRITSDAKEIHAISFSLTLRFEITISLLSLYFQHATLMLHGLPTLFHTIWWSSSLYSILLDGHLIFSLCILLCWNINYNHAFDLHVIISRCKGYLCMFLVGSNKRSIAFYNGWKWLTNQYHLYHCYEDI